MPASKKTQSKPASKRQSKATTTVKAKKPKLGSPEWEKTLHPEVQQFLNAAKNLKWGGD
jgi:hypothetical protein